MLPNMVLSSRAAETGSIPDLPRAAAKRGRLLQRGVYFAQYKSDAPRVDAWPNQRLCVVQTRGARAACAARRQVEKASVNRLTVRATRDCAARFTLYARTMGTAARYKIATLERASATSRTTIRHYQMLGLL